MTESITKVMKYTSKYKTIVPYIQNIQLSIVRHTIISAILLDPTISAILLDPTDF
jgi:hypothetical protein